MQLLQEGIPDKINLQSDAPIALFIPALDFGGAERVMLNLARGLVAEGACVDLCVARAEGVFMSNIPEGVRLINLKSSKPILAIPALAKYLKETKPICLIASMAHTGIASLIARSIAGMHTPIIVRQESTWSKMQQNMRGRHRLLNPLFARLLLPRAEHIISVSNGVREDLVSAFPSLVGKVATIKNPVLDVDVGAKVHSPVDHPWFAEKERIPVIVAVGRFVVAKGFDVLIEAMPILVRQRQLRLIIYGDGDQKRLLQQRISELHLNDCIDLPGFIANPYAVMRAASVFVMPSRWEGLPTVLVEALSAGANIVASNCPSGPAEILDNGRLGRLADPENIDDLVREICNALDNPMGKTSEGKDWVRAYGIQQSTRAHLSLIRKTVGKA